MIQDLQAITLDISPITFGKQWAIQPTRWVAHEFGRYLIFNQFVGSFPDTWDEATLEHRIFDLYMPEFDFGYRYLDANHWTHIENGYQTSPLLDEKQYKERSANRVLAPDPMPKMCHQAWLYDRCDGFCIYPLLTVDALDRQAFIDRVILEAKRFVWFLWDRPMSDFPLHYD